MIKPRTPIIVGVSQFTNRKNTTSPLEPIDMMVKTSKEAIQDTGNLEIKNHISSLFILNVSSWKYKNLENFLGDKLGFDPRKSKYCQVSGSMPQKLVNQASVEIANGSSQAVLITGGESQYSVRKAKKSKIELNWTKQTRINPGDLNSIKSISDFEKKYGLILPIITYAMFETAIRASTERTVKEHAEYMGRLLHHFSEVAAKNPHAWTREPFTAEQIATPGPGNRNVCYPYTKRMVANNNVDQSASIVMTSVELAEKLGIKEKLWVFPMGGADINNIYEITRRPYFHDSPAIKEATRLALEQAGLGLDQIDVFDLYSCFPSMVEYAFHELGIGLDDPRDLTLTGGLPFAGGPFSGYSTHAIVTAMERIRGNPSLKAMVLANGLFNTKESVGIYGTNPPVQPWGEKDVSSVQEAIFSRALPEPTENANGKMTIEAYTFVYNRDGMPIRGISIGTLDDGTRTIAEIMGTPEEHLELSKRDLVGNAGVVHHDEKKGLNFLKLNG